MLCLQETKCDTAKLDKMLYHEKIPPGYAQYWNGPTRRKGYSGTAIFTKVRPVSVQFDFGTKHVDEGRSITMEFKSFTLVAAYVPTPRDDHSRLDYRTKEWDVDFHAYLKRLETENGKPVVLAGDLNVAHEEIDIYNPKDKDKVPGFTPRERSNFEDLLTRQGFCDAFRHLYPTRVQFSYWSSKLNLRRFNCGWRIDYFLLSQDYESKYGIELVDSVIEDTIKGSDHCPIQLQLQVPLESHLDLNDSGLSDGEPAKKKVEKAPEVSLECSLGLLGMNGLPSLGSVQKSLNDKTRNRPPDSKHL